jgi:hypothetical protein
MPDDWAPGMPADPFLLVDAGDPFAALFPCLGWTAHPPGAKPPAQLRCRYSWVQLMLHSCLVAGDDILDLSVLLTFARPSKLSRVWTVLSHHVEEHEPFVTFTTAWKACVAAAQLLWGDPELVLHLADGIA